MRPSLALLASGRAIFGAIPCEAVDLFGRIRTSNRPHLGPRSVIGTALGPAAAFGA
jgi:hypothetical protein